MTLRENVIAFIKSEYGISGEKPWATSPENEVFRHEDNKKWFAIIMSVKRSTLGLAGDGYVDIMNVKLEPMFIEVLRGQEGFLPAYHMNKVSWISIRLDGSVPEETIFNLIDQSYTETASKKTKKEQKRIGPKEWLIPANPKFYDVVSAFRERKVITWKQSSDIHVDDIIYMYVGAPYSSIMYKCKALEVDIPRSYSDENLTIKRVMEIELLETYEPGIWSFERMKLYNVRAVRGPRSMPEELSRDISL
ncbi:MAG: MmcQ/YjbR family DNA-binding protein [Clostridiales bacterium]|nr:MmcQ/YjbR family DNA-binding protein [Candidatus Blautia equi]